MCGYLVLLPLPDLNEEGHEAEQLLYGDVPVSVLVKQVEDLEQIEDLEQVKDLEQVDALEQVTDLKQLMI